MPAIDLSPNDLIGLTADEAAALQASNADTLLAMHGDTKPAPAADKTAAPAEGGSASTPEAGETGSASSAAPAENAEEADADLSAGQLQAALEEAAPPAAAPAPKPYTVPDTDFEAQRKELLASKTKIEREWSAGTLTDDQRIDQLAEVDDKLFSLVREQTRAETLREANEQAARNAQASIEAQENAAMQAVAAAEAKAIAAGKPGIDYAKDVKAQQQFDAYFTAVNADPDNASLTPAQRVAEAHRLVQAKRGIAAAPAAAPVAAPAAPAAPARRDVPVTLSGLPNAGQATARDDMLEQAGRLQGEDLERWMAGQTPETVGRLMRLADNPATTH